MALNLHFGNYNVGRLTVTSNQSNRVKSVAREDIRHLGPYVMGARISDYVPTSHNPVKNGILHAKCSHVYSIDGSAYVFLSNASEDMGDLEKSLERAISSTEREIFSTMCASDPAVRSTKNVYGHFFQSEFDLPSHEDLFKDVLSDPVNAASASSPIITRDRGFFVRDADKTMSREPEYVRVYKKAFIQPFPTLQLKEIKVTGVRYKRDGASGNSFNGNCDATARSGDRVRLRPGLLGHLFYGGDEYSGFVRYIDFEKCIGQILCKFLKKEIADKVHMITHKDDAKRANMSDVFVNQYWVSAVTLKRLFISYAPASHSFVLICSLCVEYVSVRVTHCVPTEFALFGDWSSPHNKARTNIPCAVNLNGGELLHNKDMRSVARELYMLMTVKKNDSTNNSTSPNSICRPRNDETVCSMDLGRLHAMAIAVIIFAYTTVMYGLRQKLVIWFHTDIIRTSFEDILAYIEIPSECGNVGAMVYQCVEFRIHDDTSFYARDPVSFDDMISYVDSLIRARVHSYANILQNRRVGYAGNQKTRFLPLKMYYPGNVADTFAFSRPSVTTTAEPEDENTEINSPSCEEVWMFVDPTDDMKSICSDNVVRTLSVSTAAHVPWEGHIIC
jgi:hypothetical protein